MSRVLRSLIALAVPRHDREWILGDVEEEYAAIERGQGTRAARRWLRGEALRVVAGAWRRRRAGPPDRSSRQSFVLSTIAQDIRYALRLVRRSPGFAIATTLTLAIGIGANTTIFSVAQAVLLKPLPYDAPERLVRVFDTNEQQPKFPVTPANFLEYRAATSFSALAAYQRNDLQIAGDRPEQLRGMAVTAGFFTLLGWQPEIGRDFTADEEIPGGANVAILGHNLWMRRFGADPAMVGRTILLSDKPYVVVGILRDGFQHVGGTYRSYPHGDTVDIWSLQKIRPVPSRFDRRAHFLNLVGRLRDDATVERARQELHAIAVRLGQQYPGPNSGWGTWATPLREEIVGRTEPMILVLVAAVQIVLVLACVNVAGLLLGRATGRWREVGVRAALGATRGRLIRQLTVESIVLATGGGLAGIGVAAALVPLLPLVGPADVPRMPAVALDWGVMLYAGLVTVATAVLFGLAPAFQLARPRIVDALGNGGRGSSGGHGAFRSALVTAEVALAFVLVVGAGLLVRSFVNLSAVDPGFRPGGVLTARVSLPAPRYPDLNASAAFYQRARARLLSLPGVREVGFGTNLPWTGYDENSTFSIAGRTFPPGQGPVGRFHMATPGYFGALGIPLVAGRDFTASDTHDGTQVTVVNEALARRYWQEPRDAVGGRVNMFGDDRVIVGVVGDVRDTPWADRAEPAYYFPQAQESFGDMMLVLGATGDSISVVQPVIAAMREIDPALPLAEVAPLESVAASALAFRRLLAVLVGAFGVASLLLSVVGVYGVMAQAVGQRTREFGVRLALGATRGEILRLVLRSAAAIAAVGAMAGAALAAVSTRWLGSVLYGVSPTNPAIFIVVGTLLSLSVLAASYLPARRAAHLDPTISLRSE